MSYTYIQRNSYETICIVFTSFRFHCHATFLRAQGVTEYIHFVAGVGIWLSLIFEMIFVLSK